MSQGIITPGPTLQQWMGSTSRPSVSVNMALHRTLSFMNGWS